MYPEHLTASMKEELVKEGFMDLTSAQQVSELLENRKETTLIVVNSVCGCAAGSARPGVKLALKNSKIRPTNLATVFAGVDAEATQKAREHMLPYPPSSPAIALFKDGELAHIIERHHIEGRTVEMLADHLSAVFEELC